MKVTAFDPDARLIIIYVHIFGPLGDVECRFALDCAATTTLLVPGVLDALGYSPLTGDTISTVTSAIGIEPGYLRRVSVFRALGFEHTDFQVNASDLHSIVRHSGPSPFLATICHPRGIQPRQPVRTALPAEFAQNHAGGRPTTALRQAWPSRWQSRPWRMIIAIRRSMG